MQTLHHDRSRKNIKEDFSTCDDSTRVSKIQGETMNEKHTAFTEVFGRSIHVRLEDAACTGGTSNKKHYIPTRIVRRGR